MADKKISQLDSTTSVNSDAVFPLSQLEGENLKTVKGTVEQIGDYIAKVQDHSTLNTVSKKLIGAINEILASGIGSIEGSASGSVASFNDGGDNIPVKSLVAYITAVQAGEGTPSPSNVRAITGWSQAQITRTGKNLCPFLEQGQLSQTTGEEVASDTVRRSGFIGVEAGQTYAFSNLSTSSTQTNKRLRVFYYDRWKTYINNETTELFDTSVNVTIPSGVGYIRFQASGTVLTETNAQVEKGSTPTTYEPYKGTTYTIALGSTVYGGTLDVTKGILTVTHLKVSGKVTEVVSSSYSNITYGRFAKPNDSKDMGKASINLISSEYEVDTRTRDWDDIANIGKIFGGASTAWYWIGFTKNTSLADMQTESNDNEIVYELATPITIQLTPTEVRTLIGENNIYADSGDVEVEYFNEDARQFNELIETIITSSSSDYHVYSTNEKVVGRWIDGKPIYEKTIDFGSDFTVNYNGWSETTVDCSTVDSYLYGEGYTSGGTYGGNIMCSKKSNNKLEVQTARNGTSQIIRYLTIRYTKTTD